MLEPIWVSGRRAALIWGVSPTVASKVARAAGIRQKVLPGMKPKYCLQDIERVGRQALVGIPVEAAEMAGV